MKLIVLIATVAALLGITGSAKAEPAPTTTAPSAAAPTTAPSDDDYLPPAEGGVAGGMTPLFDGKSLEGWVQIPPDSWTVKNGAIVSRGVGRGVIYTAQPYQRYRIVFDMRHIYGNKDHQACVLVFCTMPQSGEEPLDALGGIQFQVPNGGHWDYRKGHNNSGKEEFTQLPHPKFDVRQWSRVEILVDPATGTARMAVAQPPGSPAVEVLDFKEPTAGQPGPLALQMHNKGLFDEYANIAIDVNPTNHELVTVKQPQQQ